MHKRVQKTDKGYFVRNDISEIHRVRDLILECLNNSNVSLVDALTALTYLSVEVSHSSKIKKAHFLAKVSEHWEIMDGYDLYN